MKQLINTEEVRLELIYKLQELRLRYRRIEGQHTVSDIECVERGEKQLEAWLMTRLTDLNKAHEEAMAAERKHCMDLISDCQQEHNEARHGNTPDDAYDRAIDCINPALLEVNSLDK